MKRLPTLTMITFCIGLALPGLTCAQTVYQWQDDTGAVHFSDSPPPSDALDPQSTSFGPYRDPPPPDPNLEAIKQQQQIARLERDIAKLERDQARERSRPTTPPVVVINQDSGYVPVYGYRRPGYWPGHWPGNRPGRPPVHLPGRPGPPQPDPTQSDWTHLPDNTPGITRISNQQQRLGNPKR